MLRYRCAQLARLLPLLLALPASAETLELSQPDLDRWMYPFNGTPGTRTTAPTFGAVNEEDFDDRDSQIVVGYDLAQAGVAAGRGSAGYRVAAVRLEATIAQGGLFQYDGTFDSYRTSLPVGDPNRLPDSDAGRPIELSGVSFRNDYTHLSFEDVPSPNLTGPPAFEETESFSPPSMTAQGVRNAFAANFDQSGALYDISNNLLEGFETTPWAVGTASLAPGAVVPQGTTFTFEIDLDSPYVGRYFRQALDEGTLGLALTSLHEAGFGQPPNYPIFFMRENGAGNAVPFRLVLDYELALLGDGNGDNQVTGADYTIWADHFGQSGPGVDPAVGDYNDDGQVTGADYTIWADHFGQSLAPTAVPEPASYLLGASAAFAAAFLRLRVRFAIQRGVAS